MKQSNVPYDKQIFVCTNVNENDKPCCGVDKGEDIFKRLRAIAKERGVHPRIRVAQAKCLGQCSHGGNVMVYPDNVWYTEVTLADAEKLADKYLIN
ncbi:MAG: (2Fe-2S) ferredoxin [Candidatus Omnitrophota bacterium]|jgi:(2Fe-2S) ferredoxin